MDRSFRTRGLITLLVFLFSIVAAIYVASRPRLASGQDPLVDIQNIETLRSRFNQDAGKARLILLLSPT
jgi:hypothetical protein